MSEHEEPTSDEFGKPIPTSTGLGQNDPGFAVWGASTQITLQGIDEEARAREGRAPSPFTIATWKIVVFFVVMFLLGAAAFTYLAVTGGPHFFRGEVNAPYGQ